MAPGGEEGPAEQGMTERERRERGERISLWLLCSCVETYWEKIKRDLQSLLQSFRAKSKSSLRSLLARPFCLLLVRSKPVFHYSILTNESATGSIEFKCFPHLNVDTQLQDI